MKSAANELDRAIEKAAAEHSRNVVWRCRARGTPEHTSMEKKCSSSWRTLYRLCLQREKTRSHKKD